MTQGLRIGILISGTGTNMQAIVKACDNNEINGEVVFVASDNLKAKGLKYARKRKIPTLTVNYEQFEVSVNTARSNNERLAKALPSDVDYYKLLAKGESLLPKNLITQSEKFAWFLPRILAEEALLQKMREFEFDLLVLAGYMRVLTPYIIDEINGFEDATNLLSYTKNEIDECWDVPKIMNIHPSLLPAFPGVDGYGDTIRYGCKVGGCTVHFVDYGEDTGPIIGQCAIQVLSEDDVDSFRERGLQEEYKLFPKCIQLFADDRLRIIEDDTGRKVVQILSE